MFITLTHDQRHAICRASSAACRAAKRGVKVLINGSTGPLLNVVGLEGGGEPVREGGDSALA
jgi:hypothetical protein